MREWCPGRLDVVGWLEKAVVVVSRRVLYS